MAVNSRGNIFRLPPHQLLKNVVPTARSDFPSDQKFTEEFKIFVRGKIFLLSKVDWQRGVRIY